jgi:hypothetical protein
MDENTWRFAQLLMWLLGAQTAFITAILSIIWSKLNRIEERMNDIDKPVFAMETMMHMKDCCMLKEDRMHKKAE